MPRFEINDGEKTFEIVAPSQDAAASAFQNWRGNVTVKSNTTPAQQSPSIIEDVAKSIPAGIAKGAAGLVGLPDQLRQAADFAAEHTVGRAINAVRSGDWSPAPSERPQSMADAIAPPSTETVVRGIENVTGPLHKPQTQAGKYAHTVGEFLPGSLVGGGGVVSNMVKFGAVPGVASEAAGQATEGSSFEPVARVGAALAGAGAAALVSRPSNTSQMIRKQMPEGVTPQMVDQAEALIIDAAQQGIALSWPEALSHAAGRPVLTNTMRHLEASPQSEARMAEFFAQRPQQVDQAAGQAFNTITPAAPNPSTIGPAVGAAAEGAVNDVRGAINAVTDPLYTAAAGVRLTPQEMARVRALPGYDEAVGTIRNNPQLARYVQGMPEDSVGFLNEVKKQLDAAAEGSRAPLTGNPNRQVHAGYSQDAAAARNIGIQASPEYAQALATQEQLRNQYLQPLLDGPLGKIASRDTATKKAIDALFPANPLPNSADEIATAVTAVSQRNPNAARQLVRAHMEMVFNEAAKDLISGANQAGGAKFRAALIGNPQRAANLEAAVRALPNGDQIWPGINRFLDVLQATGQRMHVGSRTSYNDLVSEAMKSGGNVSEILKAATNPMQGLKGFADKWDRWRLGQNLDELARVFTDPTAANMFRAIARMPANSRTAQNIATRIVALTQASVGAPR